MFSLAFIRAPPHRRMMSIAFSLGQRRWRGGEGDALVGPAERESTRGAISATHFLSSSLPLARSSRRTRLWQLVAAAKSVLFIGVSISLSEPGEKGGGGLHGDTLALLLGQVVTLRPPVEGVLGDQVAVVEGVEEL